MANMSFNAIREKNVAKISEFTNNASSFFKKGRMRLVFLCIVLFDFSLTVKAAPLNV